MQKSNLKLEYLEATISNQEKLISDLKRELSEKNEIINSFPQLSSTSLGKSTSDGKIIYRNWWKANISEYNGFCDTIWFTKFLKHHFPDSNYKFNFFSVFGSHDNIMNNMDGKKIFFSGECLNKFYLHFNKNFGDYALDYVDLAMGYDLLNHNKYFRFPLWMIWCFSPTVNEEGIEKTIDYWNSQESNKIYDVGNVSSHDNYNTRTLIADSISDFAKISYGGRWRNNTSDLWEKYGDNKIEFLKNFKFNICAENVIDNGYVSEKIFDSIKSDSIPLYAGGGNYLEPKIFNKNAILTWDFNNDNSDSIEVLKNLIEDEKSYKEFKDQTILLDNCEKYIIKQFSIFKKHFENLIYD